MADVADYITLAELKVAMEVSDTSYDSVAPPLITAASKLLNTYLQRQVTPADAGPTSHTFELGPASYLLDLAPWDLAAATQVKLHPEASDGGTVLTAGADYEVWPPEAEDGVYTHLRLSSYLVPVSDHLWRFGTMRLQVAGSWGFASVPQGLKQACIAAVRSWLRRDYPGGGYPGMDAPRDVQPAVPGAGSELPLAAMRLANPWRRTAGAA